MHGLISDVAVKRRIRNYVQIAYGNRSPYGIFIAHSINLNRMIALAHEQANDGYQDAKASRIGSRQLGIGCARISMMFVLLGLS